MRCLVKATNGLLCVFFASFLASPAALNAAETPTKSTPIDISANSVPTPTAAASQNSAQTRVAESYGDLPLSFEENRGQSDQHVRFLSRGAGYSFFLTPREAVLAFSHDQPQSTSTVLRLQLAGSNPGARISGADPLPGSSNYFLGKDPSNWRTGVSTYRKVAYENIYPGINLVYYGNQRQLEYDFVVAPGADPRMIRLAVEGARKLTVDAQGNLVLPANGEEVRLLAPKIYQDVDGQRREIAGQWTLDGANTAGFRVSAYDHSRALVIDPVLLYSSFLGGTQKNSLSRIAIDSAGNAYVAGFTASGDFPASPTPQATTFGGGTAQRGVFVAKIDPTGSTLLYSTYLSGSVSEQATGLAIDAAGNAYVTGSTGSSDFPVRNAFQSACAANPSTGTCSNAFLTKISPTGDALLYSTYLGGTGADSAASLAVDSKGNAYLVGTTSSQDFPATAGSLQTKCGGACTQNAFLARFNTTGESLLFATYLGGSGSDTASDIALDSAGNAYITGVTTSPDFPLATPFQKTCTVASSSPASACLGTAFVAKIKSDGSALAFSTYLGGSLGSQATGIAVDSLGSAYVTGNTQSPDFPVVKAFQKTCGIDAVTGKCSVDVFLSKFTPAGKALVYSTYLGGSGRDEASGIALDAAGNAHLVGRTESVDFPTAKPLQPHLSGASDAFAARFNAGGSALEFSTYHGGSATEAGNAIALDAKGNIYLAGETSSPDFPTSHPFQSSCAGACANAFVSKMAAVPPAGAPASITPNSGTTPQSATVNAAFATTLSATVLDSLSNPVPGVLVVFTAPNTTTAASGTFANGTNTTTATTDVSGVATATAFTANPFAGGPYTVTATVSGLTANFSLTNTAGTVSTVTPVAGTTPQSALVNNPFANNLAVTVLDGGGKPLGGLTVTFTAPSTTTAASGTFANGTHTTMANTDINGVATASVFTANSFAGGPYTVTGVTAAKTANFALTNTAGTVNTVTPVAGTTPQTAVVNNPFANNLAVTVLDGGGKPLGGLTVTFSAPSTTTGASGTFANGTNTTTANTDINGVATASVFTANSFGGPYAVTGLTAAKTANFALTNTAGTVGSVTARAGTTPQSAVVNNPFATNLSVTVLDGANKPLSGLTVNFTSPNTTTAASGTFANGTNTTTATTDSSGVATASVFTANPFAGGPYTVTGATGGKSANFSLTNTAGTVNTITANSGTTPQNAIVNNPFANNLAVTVLDGGGKPLGGLTIIFTAPSTTTAASGNFANGTNTTTANTDISGVATASVLTANPFAGGPYLVAGAIGAKSATFSLTNTPGTVNSVTPRPSTTPQSAVVATPFSKDLAVTVLDAAGKPLGGLPVIFTAPNTTIAASGTFANGTNTTTANTDINGIATATVFTADSVAGGAYTVTGTTAGLTANFSLTNVPDLPFAILPIPGSTPQAVPVTNPFLPLSGTVTDKFGNTVLSGIVINLTAPSSGASGTFADSGTFSTTATTNNLGVFTAAIFTANATSGAYNVNAASQTGTATTKYALTNADFTLQQTPPTSTIFIQGQITPISTSAPPIVTVTPLPAPSPTTFSYTGTVTLGCVSATLPAGVTCQSFTPPTVTFNNGVPTGPTSSSLTLSVSASTPVGNYSISVMGVDSSAPHKITHMATFNLAVECTFSLGSSSSGSTAPVPTFSPVLNGAANPFPFGASVTEVQGGSNCPWTAAAVSDTNAIPPGITLSTASGTDTAAGSSMPENFEVTANAGATALSGTITLSYFAAPPASGTSVLTVTQEVPVQLSAAVGTTSVNLTATPQTGTLTIPNVNGLQVTTVCSAANALGPDPSLQNFDITCTASALQLSVTVSPATPVLQSKRGSAGMELFYAAAFGFPAIVLLGAGASAFGPKRRRPALRRIASMVGLFLLISLLLLLPACGGGFHATFGVHQTANYTLTVMGYVTDSSNNVTGVEIFTVPLTIVK